MITKQYTIEDILNGLESPQYEKNLPNNVSVWSRIANKDNFDELGLEPSALDIFLKGWIESNPYSNI